MKKIIAFVLVIIISLCSCSAEDVPQTPEEIISKAITAQKTAFEIPKTGKLISENGLTADDSIANWTVLAAFISGEEEDYPLYLSMLKKDCEKMYSEESKLLHTRATEWHRRIMLISALGGDPTDFGKKSDGSKIDLLNDGVFDFVGGDVGKQGVNGYIYALISVDCADYSVPENSVNTRESLVSAILEKQESDGGFSLIPGSSDVDLTAMAITALAKYKDDDKVNSAIKKGIDYIVSAQDKTGRFCYHDIDSSESCSQVIIALCSVGIDPRTYEDLMKNGNSIYDTLLSYITKDGGFSSSLPSKESNALSTEQAMLALIAVERFENGKRLYDFT